MSLADRIAELFDVDEMRHLVASIDPKVMVDIPDSAATRRDVAHHIVPLFRARGQLSQLVEAAVTRLPDRAAELAAALAREPASGAPATRLASRATLPRLRSGTLPPRPYFTGREAELEQLRAWIRAPGHATLRQMEGEGGVGKTELARYLYAEVQAAGRPAVWVQLTGLSQRNALRALLDAVPHARALPEDADEAVLANAARRELGPYAGFLVLDDAEPQHRLPELVPGPDWNVLVTTRMRSVLFGTPIPVNHLPRDAAIRLLCRVAWGTDLPPAAGTAELDSLAALLGDLPLALEIAADTLGSEELSPADYLSELRAAGTPPGSDRARVAAVLTRNLRDLGADAEHVLRALSALPALGPLLFQITAAADRPAAEVTRHLKRLVRHHLVQLATETGVYQVHAFVRDHLLDRRGEEAGRASARAYVATHDWVFETVGKNGRTVDGRWGQVAPMVRVWDLELTTADAAFRPRVASAVVGFDPLRQQHDRLADRVDLLERARGWSAGNPHAEANTLLALADLHLGRDGLDEAEAGYTAALGLFRAVEDRLGEANTLLALADLHRRTDRLPEAEVGYVAALGVFRAVEDRLGEANTQKALADLHLRMTRLGEAEAGYTAALGLYRALEARLGEANTLQALGDLERERQKLAAALEHYLAARALYLAVGDSLGLSNVLAELARVYGMRGDRQNARAAAEAALPLARRCQSGYAAGLAQRVLAWVNRAEAP